MVKAINISSRSWIDRKNKKKLIDQTEIQEQTEPNVNSCSFRKNYQELTWIKLVVVKIFRCLKCNCNTSENGFHKKCVASSFQRSVNSYFQVSVWTTTSVRRFFKLLFLVCLPIAFQLILSTMKILLKLYR